MLLREAYYVHVLFIVVSYAYVFLYTNLDVRACFRLGYIKSYYII
jgi:hypothetical protein